MKPLRIFNLDLHISVIADLTAVFGELGHSVTSWSLSGHTWVFGRGPDPVEVVTARNWRGLGVIDRSLCDAFYARYKDELAGYDAFLVTYPPAQKQLTFAFALCHMGRRPLKAREKMGQFLPKVRVKPDELKALWAAARATGLSFSDWVRGVLLHAARNPENVPPAADVDLGAPTIKNGDGKTHRPPRRRARGGTASGRSAARG